MRQKDTAHAALAAHVRQSHARRRALAQDVAAEDEQLGRPAAGLGVEAAGAFDQAAGFDQAAEVLLVQAHAGEGFDDALELQEGERGRQQLEDDGAVFDLAAQAAEGGGEDAPVVGRPSARPGRARSGRGERRTGIAFEAGASMVAPASGTRQAS